MVCARVERRLWPWMVTGACMHDGVRTCGEETVAVDGDRCVHA